MKDWTGNKASAKTLLGVNYKTNTTAERERHDYYATDPKAVRLLDRKIRLPKYIWEPACGAGHLSNELRRLGHTVYEGDIVNRTGRHLYSGDFLQTKRMPRYTRCILTNPPYKYATEFILHALELLPEDGICCMLLNLNYLSGKTRFRDIYSKNRPFVYIFTGRIECAKNGEFRNKGGEAINYAWFVWGKRNPVGGLIDWIDTEDDADGL